MFEEQQNAEITLNTKTSWYELVYSTHLTHRSHNQIWHQGTWELKVPTKSFFLWRADSRSLSGMLYMSNTLRCLTVAWLSSLAIPTSDFLFISLNRDSGMSVPYIMKCSCQCQQECEQANHCKPIPSPQRHRHHLYCSWRSAGGMMAMCLNSFSRITEVGDNSLSQSFDFFF